MVRMLALAGAIILAACSPSEPGQAQASEAPVAAANEAVHPISGLRIIDVTIKTTNGTITFKTELADTPEAQARGLMFRTELADDEAMLFPSDVPETRSFWMKNTPLPLDLIFIGTDGRIMNIEAGEPYSLESIPSAGLATAVFEIRGGLSEELGIRPGDKVDYRHPE